MKKSKITMILWCSENPNIPLKFAKLVQKKPNMFNNLNNFDSFWTGFGNLGRIFGFFELHLHDSWSF